MAAKAAVLLLAACAAYQVHARSLLGDAEPASCDVAGICSGCGLTPLSLDSTTSKLRGFGPGVSAHMCLINAAVEDFTLEVNGDGIMGACTYKGTLKPDGTYELAAKDDTCSLTPGCISVKAKGACVEISHTCATPLPSVVFHSQKCAAKMVVASAGAEPACKIGWCGKCEKDCGGGKEQLCSADCVPKDTTQCRDNTKCTVRNTIKPKLISESVCEANCPAFNAEPVQCPPCKCECSCTPTLKVNDYPVPIPSGACRGEYTVDGKKITPVCPEQEADVEITESAECGVTGECKCDKTGSCQKTGTCKGDLVTCPKSGGKSFYPCYGPDCSKWSQGN